MDLRKKSDSQLLSELTHLAAQEKEIHLQVIQYLREVERRDLHLARGFSSLFAFCTGFLGFTEAEAHVRIQAMRLSKEIPTIEEKIRSGKLSLTNVAQAQAVFRQKKLDREQKEYVLTSLENKSTRAAERTLASLFPEQPKPEKTFAVSEELTRIEFTVSKALMEKIERLKQVLAHKNFSGRYDLLFEHLINEAIKKYFLPPKNDAPFLGAPQATKTNRFINSETRRKIWSQFDQGCAYTDPLTNRRCSSKHGLEIDHIQDFAKGGTNHPENLQLLCPAHNKFKSRMSTKPYRKN